MVLDWCWIWRLGVGNRDWGIGLRWLGMRGERCGKGDVVLIHRV